MGIILSSISRSRSDIPEETILKLLKTARIVEREREKLHQLYISWNENTEETITKLLAIRDDLKKYLFKSNCAFLFGSTVTVLGAIAGVTGSLLEISELSRRLIIGGTTTATTGSVICASSHIANNYLSKNLCIEAKSVFELNLKYIDDLEQSRITYFQFLKEFNDQLDNLILNHNEKILSILEEENPGYNLNDLHLSEYQVNQSSMSSTVSEMKKLSQNFEIEKKKNNLKEYVIELKSVINIDPNMKKMIQDRIPRKLHESIRPVVDRISDRIKSKISMEIASWMIDSDENLRFLFSEMSLVVKASLGILNAIFLAWGMINMVNTSINIYRGSETDQMREILQQAKKLHEIREKVIRINREIFKWDLNVKEN